MWILQVIPCAELYYQLPSTSPAPSLGNLYIADSSSNCIRKVTASTGIITTVAGTGTAGYNGDGGAATSATLNSPTGVALDSSGTLLHSDIFGRNATFSVVTLF
jgi:hypothetical protein